MMRVRTYIQFIAAGVLIAGVVTLYVQNARLEKELAQSQKDVVTLEKTISEQNGKIEQFRLATDAANAKAAASARLVLLNGARRRVEFHTAEHGPAALNRWLREVVQ